MEQQHGSDGADSSVVGRCSAGHAASRVSMSRVSMSRAGCGSDLHSHMPGGVLIQVTAARRGFVLIGPVAMEPRGDSGARGACKTSDWGGGSAGSLKVV